MQTLKQVSLTTLVSLAIVLFASLIYKPSAHSSTIDPQGGMQSVTITAQRMTAEQKARFDLEQAAIPNITTVGKLMTAAEKAAFDRADGM